MYFEKASVGYLEKNVFYIKRKTYNIFREYMRISKRAIEKKNLDLHDSHQ
jgi:hypothetical protein